MTRSRDLLERFRPAGAPGAATPPGVPAERGASVRDELTPVLALLAPTEAEVEAVQEEARANAARISADASNRAAALAAQAHERADEARAEASARARRRRDEATSAELDRSSREAEQLRTAARPRLAAVVASVVSAVREELVARSSAAGRATDAGAPSSHRSP